MVPRFLSESVAPKTYRKVIFPDSQIHHRIFLLAWFHKFLRYLVLYFDPIFLRNRFHFDLQMIFAGAVVQLHVTCGDHCFAWFSSKNMIIFFYGKEEPSKICSDLNEWRLSSVSWSTPLVLGRHGFESCWSLNFSSGFSVSATV